MKKGKWDTIINQAIRQARLIDKEREWKIGDVVAHVDEPLACEIIRFEGDIATIGNCKNVCREFPISELFDPNLAYALALKIQKGLN